MTVRFFCFFYLIHIFFAGGLVEAISPKVFMKYFHFQSVFLLHLSTCFFLGSYLVAVREQALVVRNTFNRSDKVASYSLVNMFFVALFTKVHKHLQVTDKSMNASVPLLN